MKIDFMTAAQAQATFCLLQKAPWESSLNKLKIQRVLSSTKSPGQNDAVVLTATIDDRVAGFILLVTAGKDNSGQPRFEIDALLVAPELRGQGVGRKLLGHAENFIARDWLKNKPGTLRLNDYTKTENPKSRYYENAGYAIPPYTPVRKPPTLQKTLNAPGVNPA